MERIDVNTLPEDFRQYLRRKLADKSDEALAEALELYAEGILGFLAITNAQEGTIDVKAVKQRYQEQVKSQEQKQKEAKARYEQEQKYNASLTWLYEINSHEFNYGGGYCAGVDSEGVIRIICYESGDHRQGGAIYTNTPFGLFGSFDRVIVEIKDKAPKLYEKLAGYKAG